MPLSQGQLVCIRAVQVARIQRSQLLNPCKDACAVTLRCTIMSLLPASAEMCDPTLPCAVDSDVLLVVRDPMTRSHQFLYLQQHAHVDTINGSQCKLNANCWEA
jgi:hypothetical protein|eukprot:SAG25_NODE_491_length_7415_cov_6.908557_7_plen_104_part_00